MLWTLVLVSLLVSAIAASGSGRSRQAADLRRNVQLRDAADGAVEQAVFHLLDGSRGHWAADGAIHRVRQGDLLLTMRIVSEAGKVNPNRASLDLMVALLQAVGAENRQAVTIATSMIAWRFPNGTQVATRVPGRDYIPPGEPFESLPEIGLVLGMTPALLKAIEPHLSLYHDNDPEFASADPVVRQAMQMLAGAANPDSSTSANGGANGSNGPDGQPVGRDETLVAVTAEASDAAGRRFVRRAVVLTGNGEGRGSGRNNAGQAGSGQEGSQDRPFRILTWDAPS